MEPPADDLDAALELAHHDYNKSSLWWMVKKMTDVLFAPWGYSWRVCDMDIMLKRLWQKANHFFASGLIFVTHFPRLIFNHQEFFFLVGCDEVRKWLSNKKGSGSSWGPMRKGWMEFPLKNYHFWLPKNGSVKNMGFCFHFRICESIWKLIVPVVLG